MSKYKDVSLEITESDDWKRMKRKTMMKKSEESLRDYGIPSIKQMHHGNSRRKRERKWVKS
jgi:hypothetical protein